MIKVQDNQATRAPIPAFLIGLAPESLADLSWTDPALGVQDCAWWPEVDQSPALSQYERYGLEALTVDAVNKQVIVTRAVEPWTPEEIAQAEAEAKTALIAQFDNALSNHLDSVAQSKRYDTRITCALRAGYPGPFQAEGAAFAAWMDTCNSQAYQMWAEIEAGTRPMFASTEEFIAALPVMVWPG